MTRPAATPTSDFERHRPLLFGIAYRMTGSAADAEEIVQQTWVRRQSTGEADDERALLATIATRLSIDHLRSVRRQREQYIGPWLPEPILTTDEDPAEIAERRDLLELGLLTLLESLTPPQRATFVLREAFGYPHREIAQILGVSEAASRQHYRRAKQQLGQGPARFEVTGERQRELLERFIGAAAGQGTEPLEALLAEDVTVWGDGGGEVAAARRPVRGRETVARFIRGLIRIAPDDVAIELVEINGTPGLLVLRGSDIDGVYTFTWTDADVLAAIHAVRNPAKLAAVRSRHERHVVT